MAGRTRIFRGHILCSGYVQHLEMPALTSVSRLPACQLDRNCPMELVQQSPMESCRGSRFRPPGSGYGVAHTVMRHSRPCWTSAISPLANSPKFSYSRAASYEWLCAAIKTQRHPGTCPESSKCRIMSRNVMPTDYPPQSGELAFRRRGNQNAFCRQILMRHRFRRSMLC